MALTKKDFEAFAEWIDVYPNLAADYDWLDDLMAYCAQSNKNFNHHRFLLAAGFTEDEVVEIWGYRDE